MSVTWNPSDTGANISLSNGDLTATASAYLAYDSTRATDAKTSGKYYWEIYIEAINNNVRCGVGLSSADLDSEVGDDANGWSYYSDGDVTSSLYHNNTYSGWGSIFYAGDVIGVAIDVDAGYIWYAVNNVWQGSGDPAAGTNPAQTGVTNPIFPMCGLGRNTSPADSVTLRTVATSFSYSPPSGFDAYDTGGILNLLDGKLKINTLINLLDGKTDIKDAAISLLDGKLRINTVVNLLDGKTDVKDTKSVFFDGKTVIRDATSGLLDSKVRIKDSAINLLDGKAKLCIHTTNVFDGKATFYPIINGDLIFPFFDVEAIVGSNAFVNEFIPEFEVESFTGGVANLTFPFPSLEGIAKVGEVTTANLNLPSLTLEALTGINGLATFPFLECNGNALVGSLVKGNIELPLVKLNAEALVNIISSLEASLPEFQIDAKGLEGILATGDTTLYPLHLIGEGQVGPLANTTISLPCLVVVGDLAHQITGVANITFPMISLFAKTASLTKGCEILSYKRWR